jgi:hypothetical protein
LALKESLRSYLAATAYEYAKLRKTSGRKAKLARTLAIALGHSQNRPQYRDKFLDMRQKFFTLALKARRPVSPSFEPFVAIFDLFLAFFAPELDEVSKAFAEEIQLIFSEFKISEKDQLALRSIAAETLANSNAPAPWASYVTPENIPIFFE